VTAADTTGERPACVGATSEGPLVIVSLDRPPVNAVDLAMYAEIRDTFNGLRQAFPDGRVVVLESKGRHFCAGNDLADFETMTAANAPGRMQGVREAFWAIRDCPLPVVAAVHGSALGTGLAIAASADLIVVAEDAQLGLPEVSVGVMGGARHLARLVPQQLVRLMFLTAEPVSGADLALAGGAVRAVPRDRLAAVARELALRIARHSPNALRVGKRALNQIEAMDLKSGYETEQGYTGDLAGHPDAKEALAAFREKRRPAYAPEADAEVSGG
jgi:enoyl-CoA hydratase